MSETEKNVATAYQEVSVGKYIGGALPAHEERQRSIHLFILDPTYEPT